MSELDNKCWIELPIEDESLQFSSRPAGAKYQIAHRYGTPENNGHTVLLTDGDPTFHERLVNPRSTARSEEGTAAVADWREYGVSTGSEVIVRNESGDLLSRIELNESSPFVSLSADGSYLAVSPYSGKTRVIELDTEELVMLHSNILDDRQKPRFIGSEPKLQFSQNNDNEPAYAISLTDTVVWQSDKFQQHDFIKSLSLEKGVDWHETCTQLREAYDNSTVDIQQRVVNKLTQASLANIKSADTLEMIRDNVQQMYYAMDSDNHQKAASILLGDANYRLARAKKRDRPTNECLDAVEEALSYGYEALPWYDAKTLVVKSYRFKTRMYKQRGDIGLAIDNVEQMFEFSEKYDVRLVTDADQRLRSELLN